MSETDEYTLCESVFTEHKNKRNSSTLLEVGLVGSPRVVKQLGDPGAPESPDLLFQDVGAG